MTRICVNLKWLQEVWIGEHNFFGYDLDEEDDFNPMEKDKVRELLYDDDVSGAFVGLLPAAAH